jgi:hypothetical protein
MSVGPRRALLPLAFLGLAAALTVSSAARAQPPGGSDKSHRIWQQNLTPEQIKAALSRLGQGDGDGDADPFEEMLREYLGKQNPGLDKDQLDRTIKQLTGNKQLMEQLKQMAKQKQTDPGRPGKLSPEDLAKLKLDPGKMPADPKQPFNPKFPVDPKQPFDPKAIDPTTPPKATQPPPGTDPGNPMPPMPPVGNPMPPPGAPGAPRPPSLDENPFPEPEESGDPRTKSLQAFAALWERNVGPLDQTPEVKRALFDLVSGTNGLDLDITDDKGNSIWDLIRKGDGSGLSFGDFMDGAGGSWHLPQFDLPSMNWGKWWGGSSSSSGSGSSSSWSSGSSSRPRPGSSGSGGGFGGLGFAGSWTPVVILGVVVLGVLLWVLLKHLREGEPRVAYATEGLGPWPIDPRMINTREDVVKAFEYLSVLICGPSAKTWTHNTIADALSELAATHGETAVMLARLYELARYAPLDEPLTRDELMEARELVCGLAGVSY